jgi:riboflavin kinase/FMN adenylyltransferase
MTPLRRQITLDALGVAELHLLRFDAAMAAMTDREFCERLIVGEVGARAVSVGFDFRFGKGRMGDVDSLRRIGGELGFEVSIVEEVKQGGEKVSSSAIRTALERGDMGAAAEGLGGLWVVDAIVEHGEKRGRTLGYPTANMQVGEIVHPAHGVYAVWAREEGSAEWRPGVASFGRTPTTGLRDPLLETVVFDWSGDLYGKRVHTAFVTFLRPQQVFAGMDNLKAAMKQDEAGARALLASAPKPVGL